VFSPGVCASNPFSLKSQPKTLFFFFFWLPTKSNPSLLVAIKDQTQKLFVDIPQTTFSFPNYPPPAGHPSIPLYLTLPPMGQIISVMQRCLPLCFPLPESKDQNEDARGTVFKHFKKTQLNIYIYENCACLPCFNINV
jgi:hypothetical protein